MQEGSGETITPVAAFKNKAALPESSGLF